MPDTASLITVKRFQYRGEAEEFSNKYHFEGTTPADAAAWRTLLSGWITEERKIFPSSVEFVRSYGYEPGSDHANFVLDYTVPPETIVTGGFVPAGTAQICPGDAAATVRWNTGEYNSRGKLIYCRKYFHAVYRDSPTPDSLDQEQAAAMASFAEIVISGFLPGSAKYCGPQGANLSSPRVDPWITTRTLKRRGKRPLVSAP